MNVNIYLGIADAATTQVVIGSVAPFASTLLITDLVIQRPDGTLHTADPAGTVTDNVADSGIWYYTANDFPVPGVYTITLRAGASYSLLNPVQITVNPIVPGSPPKPTPGSVVIQSGSGDGSTTKFSWGTTAPLVTTGTSADFQINKAGDGYIGTGAVGTLASDASGQLTYTYAAADFPGPGDYQMFLAQPGTNYSVHPLTITVLDVENLPAASATVYGLAGTSALTAIGNGVFADSLGSLGTSNYTTLTHDPGTGKYLLSQTAVTATGNAHKKYLMSSYTTPAATTSAICLFDSSDGVTFTALQTGFAPYSHTSPVGGVSYTKVPDTLQASDGKFYTVYEATPNNEVGIPLWQLIDPANNALYNSSSNPDGWKFLGWIYPFGGTGSTHNCWYPHFVTDAQGCVHIVFIDNSDPVQNIGPGNTRVWDIHLTVPGPPTLAGWTTAVTIKAIDPGISNAEGNMFLDNFRPFFNPADGYYYAAGDNGVGIFGTVICRSRDLLSGWERIGGLVADPSTWEGQTLVQIGGRHWAMFSGNYGGTGSFVKHTLNFPFGPWLREDLVTPSPSSDFGTQIDTSPPLSTAGCHGYSLVTEGNDFTTSYATSQWTSSTQFGQYAPVSPATGQVVVSPAGGGMGGGSCLSLGL